MSDFFPYYKSQESTFDANGETALYRAGQMLVRYDEESTWVFFLKKGLVRISYTMTTGESRILGYLLPGMTFAKPGSFFSVDGGNIEIEAIKNSTLLRMERGRFLEEVEHNRAFAKRYTENTLKNQLYLIERVAYQGERSISARCLRWLLFMAKYYGVAHNNKVVIKLPLTQETIANFMHVTRESVNKAIKPLAQDGIIRQGRTELIIEDLDALKSKVKITCTASK